MANDTDHLRGVRVEQDQINILFPSGITHASTAAANHHTKMSSFASEIQQRAHSLKHRDATNDKKQNSSKCSSSSQSGDPKRYHVADGAGDRTSVGNAGKITNVLSAGAAVTAGGDAENVVPFWSIVKKFENASAAAAAELASQSSSVVSGGNSRVGSAAKNHGSQLSSSAERSTLGAASLSSSTGSHHIHAAGAQRDEMLTKSRPDGPSSFAQQPQNYSSPANSFVCEVNGHSSRSLYNVASIKRSSFDSDGPANGINTTMTRSSNKSSPQAAAVAEKVHECVRSCIDQLRTVGFLTDTIVVDNDQSNNSFESTTFSPATNVAINRTRLSLTRNQQRSVEANGAVHTAVSVAREAETSLKNINGHQNNSSHDSIKTDGGQQRSLRKHRHHKESERSRDHVGNLMSPNSGKEKRSHNSGRKKRTSRHSGTNTGSSTIGDQVDSGIAPSSPRDAALITNSATAVSALMLDDSDEVDEIAGRSVLFGKTLQKAGISLHKLAQNPEWEAVVGHILILQGVINEKNKEIQMINKTAKESTEYMIDLQRQVEETTRDNAFLLEDNKRLNEQFDAVNRKLSRQCRENDELLHDVIVYRNKSIGLERRFKAIQQAQELTAVPINGRANSGSSGVTDDAAIDIVHGNVGTLNNSKTSNSGIERKTNKSEHIYAKMNTGHRDSHKSKHNGSGRDNIHHQEKSSQTPALRSDNITLSSPAKVTEVEHEKIVNISMPSQPLPHRDQSRRRGFWSRLQQ